MHLQQAGNSLDSYIGDTDLLLACPLVISLVKSSMLLIAHFNSCTNNITLYTTSELQCYHELLGETDQSFDVDDFAVKNSQIVTDFVLSRPAIYTFCVELQVSSGYGNKLF